MAVGPGSVLLLTVAAARLIVLIGFSFVAGFASLPCELSTYNVSAIAFAAKVAKTSTVNPIQISFR